MTSDETGRPPEGARGEGEEELGAEEGGEGGETMREIYRDDLDRHFWTPPPETEAEEVRQGVSKQWRRWLDHVKSMFGLGGDE